MVRFGAEIDLRCADCCGKVERFERGWFWLLFEFGGGEDFEDEGGEGDVDACGARETEEGAEEVEAEGEV